MKTSKQLYSMNKDSKLDPKQYRIVRQFFQLFPVHEQYSVQGSVSVIHECLGILCQIKIFQNQGNTLHFCVRPTGTTQGTWLSTFNDNIRNFRAITLWVFTVLPNQIERKTCYHQSHLCPVCAPFVPRPIRIRGTNLVITLPLCPEGLGTNLIGCDVSQPITE